MRIIKSKTWDSFEIALKSSFWGNKKNRFLSWELNEKILFFIEFDGIAIGEVIGKSFQSENSICESELFRWKIPINCKLIAKGDKGSIMQKEIKSIIAGRYGPKYGVIMLFSIKIPDFLEEDIIRYLCSQKHVTLPVT